jgi:hypothetical protein
VDGVVVDVRKDSSGSEKGCFGRVDVDAECVNECTSVGRGSERSDARLQARAFSGDGTLEVVNYGVRLIFVRLCSSLFETAHLGVDMLQSSHNYSSDLICRIFPLKQGLSLDQSQIQRYLLPQPLDVV